MGGGDIGYAPLTIYPDGKIYTQPARLTQAEAFQDCDFWNNMPGYTCFGVDRCSYVKPQ